MKHPAQALGRLPEAFLPGAFPAEQAPAWFTLPLPPEIAVTSEINKVLRPVPWKMDE